MFGMALRAVGNLTRCDENIMRVVGYGMIKGIVQGMVGNSEIPGVLQLSADVIGNLGSLDEEELPGGLEAGLAALLEGMTWRQVRVEDYVEWVILLFLILGNGPVCASAAFYVAQG